MASLALPSDVAALLRQAQFRPKKRLGQHFLMPAWQRRVIQAIQLVGDETVVELGAGWGALTLPLLTLARRVVAIELDPALSRLLRERAGEAHRLEVVTADLRTAPWGGEDRVTVVGAIPYQVTTPILERVVAEWPRLQAAWLILQREVAQRLTAAPGTKAYGRLTCFVAYRYTVKRLCDLPPAAFLPPPEVTSSLIVLRPRPSPAVAVADEPRFFRLIAVAFGTRRKTIENNLRRWGTPPLEKSECVRRLGAAGIDPRRRPETLSLEEFARLARYFQRE